MKKKTKLAVIISIAYEIFVPLMISVGAYKGPDGFIRTSSNMPEIIMIFLILNIPVLGYWAYRWYKAEDE